MVLSEGDVRAIYLTADAIEYSTAVRPVVLRCGLRMYYAARSFIAETGPVLHMSRMDRDGWWDQGSPREPKLYGLELLSDPWLPPDVWRLTDEHDTLLHDCRMAPP